MDPTITSPTLSDRLTYFAQQIAEHGTATNDMNLSGLAVALLMVANDAQHEIDTLTRERDLAIAHDRQPYPTAWAYEQACKALREHREREDRLDSALRQVLAEFRFDTHPGRRCKQTGHIDIETIGRWHAALAPTTTPATEAPRA